MRWCIPAGEKPLFGPERGCNPLAQRLLRLDATSTFSSEFEDEVVFVLAGQGTLAVGGEEHRLEPGAAVYVAREIPWTVHNPDGLEAICVRVSDPEPGVTHAFVPPDSVNTSTATAPSIQVEPSAAPLQPSPLGANPSPSIPRGSWMAKEL